MDIITWDLWHLWNLHTAYYAYSINLAVGVGQFWSALTLCDVAIMNCLWPFDQHVSYNTLNPFATEMNRCILWFSTKNWYITLKMCNGYPRKKGGKSGNWSYYLCVSQNVRILSLPIRQKHLGCRVSLKNVGEPSVLFPQASGHRGWLGYAWLPFSTRQSPCTVTWRLWLRALLAWFLPWHGQWWTHDGPKFG